MRILLSSQQARRPHAVPAYAFWEFYFKQGLAEAGHEVLEVPDVDWAEGLTALAPDARREWLARTWDRTVVFLKAEHQRQPVDLFLGYLFPDQVEPAGVAAIRALGVPCVNFFCDNVREFTQVPASYRGFDLHWVPEADARQMYTHAGLPFVYAPMPMWVAPAWRTVPANENEDVCFIGSHDALREDLLGEAVERGLKLRLHGAGWQSTPEPSAPPRRGVTQILANQLRFLRRHGFQGLAIRETYRRHQPRPRGWITRCWGPPLSPDDYARVTRESCVMIGINRYPSFRHPFANPGRYARLRDIEAPMLGACYLTEQAPGLEDLYDIGREIETYASAAELVEKAKALAGDSARRARLRQLGQKRALADHGVARSVARLSERLGLPA